MFAYPSNKLSPARLPVTPPQDLLVSRDGENLASRIDACHTRLFLFDEAAGARTSGLRECWNSSVLKALRQNSSRSDEDPKAF